jgi:predicted DNA-binding transcriptional regulator YafY
MRASRLLSMLILLQLRGRLTAEELAKEFGITARTVYRDIDSLNAAGIPVYGDRGPGGGFQLVDGYRTRLTGLAADEAEAMFLMGMPGLATELGLGTPASSAGNKLLASLPASLSAGAKRIGARFYFDSADWYHTAQLYEHLPAITRAVLDQRVAVFKYQSWKQRREWRVGPLGLVMKAGSWYLVARSGGHDRIYKVLNMSELTITKHGFERPADFNLEAFWRTDLKRFETALRPNTAVLRASSTGLTRLSMLGAFAADAVRAASAPDANGWSRLELPIERSEHTALALLGAGPEVEVLGPATLRSQIYQLATRVANCHSQKSR